MAKAKKSKVKKVKKVSRAKKLGIVKSTKGKKKILKNRVAILLDRSGSMGNIRAEALAMFNDQVKALKDGSKGMDTKVTFATFSTVADKPVIFNEDVNKLSPLALEAYVPNGWTAMYDCVGQTIDSLSKLDEAGDPDCSFLVVIISDGAENYSKEYTSTALAAKIKELQDTKRWTFTYLGANQDLAVVSQNLGIHIGNMRGFVASVPGAYSASVVNTSSTATYLHERSLGSTATTNFYSPNAGGSDTTVSTDSSGVSVSGNISTSTTTLKEKK